jgi:GNAT superfamily N-acetyltransferase
VPERELDEMAIASVRPAVPNDAPAIAEIWHLGWRDGHIGYVPDELMTVRTEESFRTRAAQRVGDTTVAVIDGQIAGFVMVVGEEVEQVYVSGHHRGAGVADLLLGEAERQVGDAGYSRAWLAVVAGNARARRFYERNGWLDEGLFEYAASSELGPIAVPCHRYVKDVGNN